MYYLLHSPFTERLYHKLKPHLSEIILCAELETQMIAESDYIIFEEILMHKVPNWLHNKQFIILSEVMEKPNSIYKYQSYLEILKAIQKQDKVILSLVTDGVPHEAVLKHFNEGFIRGAIIICSFSLNTDFDILFDLHSVNQISLNMIEPYLRKTNTPHIFELIFFKSLLDQIRPPSEQICEILSVLNKKYHLILNISPIKTELDLKLLQLSTHIFYIGDSPSKLNLNIIEQVKHIASTSDIRPLFTSTCKDQNTTFEQLLVENLRNIF